MEEAVKPVKPVREGFHTITPYLHVRGTAKLIDFLKHAFGAEEVFRLARKDGSIMHAEVRIGDSMLEMGEPEGEFQPMPCALHLYVEDADSVYERAIKAGATSMRAPSDQDYGDREGDVKDPWDNRWYIATHIKDV